MKPLTAKQAAILNYIMDHVEQNGYPPSVREMMMEFKIKSTRGITVHLDSIEKKGYIKRGAGPRLINVLKDARNCKVCLRFSVDIGVD